MVDELAQSSRDDPGIHLSTARNVAPADESRRHSAASRHARRPARWPRSAPIAWWSELNLDTREAIKAGNYASAYGIAAHTGLAPDDGLNYSEAEFMAGWTALRFLKDPQSALVAFPEHRADRDATHQRRKAHITGRGRVFEAQGDLVHAWQQ